MLLLALLLGMPVGASEAPDEQRVTPVAPQVEQRVEPIGGAAEQRVEALDAEGVQGVVGGQKSSGGRVAGTVGKAVLAVVTGVVSLGVMAASLLFL
jgi:hypothetical protein